MSRTGALVLGAALALVVVDSGLASSAGAKNNEGNRLYDQEQYDEAMRKYTDAQASLPEAPELHYNIGNVLFRKGEYDKSVGEYMRAQAAKDPELSQAATFNRGNALMLSGRVQEAVQAYVQALRADPSDQDAKRNLELALRLLEEQKEQQQKQNDEGDEKDSDEPNPQQSPPREGEQEPQKNERQPRAGQMTEEDARRILEALREEERRGVKKHAQAAGPRDRNPEKDW
jgi:Ca-activated chloride channel family protein